MDGFNLQMRALCQLTPAEEPAGSMKRRNKAYGKKKLAGT
jgi:hypothetical protein